MLVINDRKDVNVKSCQRGFVTVYQSKQKKSSNLLPVVFWVTTFVALVSIAIVML